MTKDSAEEKIVQIGRKKMALDQALIESMDAEDDAGVDLESILKHGAAALFDDDDTNDIHYDSTSVDKLLDRTQVENTETGKDKTAESQFSFARVWANDKGALTEDAGDPDDEQAAPDIRTWENILKNREAEAAAEAAKSMEDFGRGKRTRVNVDYKRGTPGPGEDAGDDQTSRRQSRKRRERDDSGSDVDFAGAGDTDGDDESEGIPEPVDRQELGLLPGHSRNKLVDQQGMKGKLLIRCRPTPQKQAPSGQRSRGSAKKGGLTISLNFSSKSVKVQNGAQKSMAIVKKAAIANKALPIMGTVAKQPIFKNVTNSGTKQAAQLISRDATPNSMQKARVGPAELNAPGSGKAQVANANCLPAKPHSLKKVKTVSENEDARSDGKKQPAQTSGLPAMPNNLDTHVVPAMASATLQAQVLANGRSSRPEIGDSGCRNMPPKTPLDSSDRRPEVPLGLQNASIGHQASETQSQQPANAKFFQDPTTPVSNIHPSFPHHDLASTAKPYNMATKAQVPPLTLSIKRTTMPSTILPCPFQLRTHPEEKALCRTGFSLKMDMDKMEEDRRRNAELDVAMHQPKLYSRQVLEFTPQVPWFSMQMDIDKAQAQKVESALSAASHI